MTECTAGEPVVTIADLDNARAVLGSLRPAGIHIALDNFGTGYSSLYHLRSFRLAKVKIDRSFVQALVGLGQGLGLTIAADGIDAADREGALLGTGCEQGRGALLGAPLDAEAAAALFSQPKAGLAS